MIALTGPTGFLGRYICEAAEKKRIQIVLLIRSPNSMSQVFSSSGRVASYTPRIIGDLGTARIDSSVLVGCSAVIHAAARAHRMGEHGPSALDAYRQTNVAGTRSLITAMSQAGVRRLVYVSSIKAVAERSNGVPLRPGDQRQPEDPYGQSKAEAEDVVLTAQAQGLIDPVIIRPVLVHGPGAKGNLQRLLSKLHQGRILPLGWAHNRRSFVGVKNLADALLSAATARWPVRHAAEALGAQGSGGLDSMDPVRVRGARSLVRASALTYHVADDGVISTRRLIEVLAEGMSVSPCLISVPHWLVVGGAALTGKGAMARRLFDNLEVDDSDFRRDFAWKPTLGLEDGLRIMAADFARRMRESFEK